LSNESEVYELYTNSHKQITQPHYKQLAARAIRTAIYQYIQLMSMGDDVPQSFNELNEILKECNEIYMGNP